MRPSLTPLSLALALAPGCREAPAPRPLVASPAGCPAAEPPEAAFPEREHDLVRLVNEARREHGLPPLGIAADLARAARLHARDMAVEGYLDHDSLGRSGGELQRECGWTERVEGLAPGYSNLGENLASGTSGPAGVIASWLESPVHRKTLLGAEYDDLGVGCWETPSGETYWVADFGGGSGRASPAARPGGD